MKRNWLANLHLAPEPTGGNPGTLEAQDLSGGATAAELLADVPKALLKDFYDLAAPQPEKAKAAAPKPAVPKPAPANAAPAASTTADAPETTTTTEPTPEPAKLPEVLQGAVDEWLSTDNRGAMPEELKTALEAWRAEGGTGALPEAVSQELGETGAEPATETEEAVPELSAEQKAWVDGQLAAKETALQEFQTKADAASKRVDELTAQVQKLEKAPPPVAGNLHPIAFVDEPAQIDQFAGRLEELIAWGRQNLDGTEAVAAEGDKAAVPAYPAAQVRAAVAAWEKQLRTLVPAAKAALQVRQQAATTARQAYPALFDPKTPEGTQVADMLRQYPILKAIFPNFHIIAGDAFRGEKIRLAEEKLKAKSKAKPAAATAPPKVAPKPGGSGLSAVVNRPAKDKTPTVQKLREAQKSAATEIEALMAIMS